MDLKDLAKQFNPPRDEGRRSRLRRIPLDDPTFREYSEQDVVVLGASSRLRHEVDGYDWREQLKAAINAQMSRMAPHRRRQGIRQALRVGGQEGVLDSITPIRGHHSIEAAVATTKKASSASSMPWLRSVDELTHPDGLAHRRAPFSYPAARPLRPRDAEARKG